MAEFGWLYEGQSMNEIHRLVPKKPKTSDEFFRELRENDPERLWLIHISCAWDDLNRCYAREGISEEFKYLRKILKNYYARYRPRISDERWAEFISRNPDREIKIWEKGRVVRTRFEHGYNFKYQAVK